MPLRTKRYPIPIHVSVTDANAILYGFIPDLAKTSPYILNPELFAIHLGSHIVAKYAHIHKAFVSVEQLRWKRIGVNGQDHTHSFWRDGDEKRTVNVEVRTPFRDQCLMECMSIDETSTDLLHSTDKHGPSRRTYTIHRLTIALERIS